MVLRMAHTRGSRHDTIHCRETRMIRMAHTRGRKHGTCAEPTHTPSRTHCARHGHGPRGGRGIAAGGHGICVVTCSVDTYSNIKIYKPERVGSLFDVMKGDHYTDSQSCLNLNLPALLSVGQRPGLYPTPANCSPKSRSFAPKTKPLLFSRFPSESRHLP